GRRARRMSERRSTEVPPEERLRPDDDCPLFSPALEDHLIALTRGEVPARGRFCGNCYTPIARDTALCPHCGNDTEQGRVPVRAVPDQITLILRSQRKIESTWVNGLAYLGLVIAVVGGIALVLSIPFFRANLIWATLLYGLILLVGGRMLAGFLGGYFGDRWGYERARARTRDAWAEWLRERDG
ncbi:MAG: zinc ribbon domain-containing protein, partial [Chloroflexi bacterium]|nr:zinc ribbon domain-containing protein [Chloroflexota bacterium]